MSWKITLAACLPILLCISSCSPTEPGVEDVNPRVYNVDFTFELRPDPGTIDNEKDLKLWLPVSRPDFTGDSIL